MTSLLKNILIGWLIGCVLVLPVEAKRRWIPKAASGPAGYTLVYDSVTGASNEFELGDTTGHYYIGQTLFNDSSSRTVGKITVKMRRGAGNTSGKTLTVTLWSLSGGTDLNVALATATVTGFNTATATNVDFIFTPAYTLSASTDYAITCDTGSVDGSNYLELYYDTLASAPLPWPATTAFARWNQDKTANGVFGAFVNSMKLYTSP